MLKRDKDSLLRYLLLATVILAVMACFTFFFSRFLPQFWTVLRYVSLLVVPFLLAWLVAVISRPLLRGLTGGLHLGPSLSAFLVILLLLLLTALLILVSVVLVAAMLSEFSPYVGNLSGYLSGFGDELDRLVTNVNLSVLGLDSYYAKLQQTVERLSSQGLGAVFQAVKAAPGAVIGILVTLVAVYYWCRDERQVRDAISLVFPRRQRGQVRAYYDSVSTVLGNYIRAQGRLMLIDTVLCLLGFLICGARTPVAAAVFAGVLDIIPFLGPGLILVPWSLWGFLTGDLLTGIGLAVTFLVFLVVRNVLQPKIVGDQVGLHPLLTLASIYIGMKAFGVAGLILGPIVVALAVALLRERRRKQPLPAE